MIRAYHIDLGQRDVRIGTYDDFDFDESGIPRYRYGGDLFYNPTFVAHYGLYELGLYLRSGEKPRHDQFIATADWFLETGRSTDAGLLFEYHMPTPGLPVPWVSALGQGRAASLLARAYEATRDGSYLDAARRSLGPFDVLSADGGVQSHFPDGGVAFEEYPRSKPDIVLNGLVTALFGVYDVAVSLGAAGVDDPHPAALFRQAVDALAANLHHYDLGYWSSYDLSGRVASDEYHAYHVSLLWALYEICGVAELAGAARAWDGLRKGPKLFVARNVSRIRSRISQRLLHR